MGAANSATPGVCGRSREIQKSAFALACRAVVRSQPPGRLGGSLLGYDCAQAVEESLLAAADEEAAFRETEGGYLCYGLAGDGPKVVNFARECWDKVANLESCSTDGKAPSGFALTPALPHWERGCEAARAKMASFERESWASWRAAR